MDCGIRSNDAARTAARVGVDLIITDHHEPDHALPAAYAVVNPKRPDCPYPEKHLAGAGVALKLTHALCRRAGRERWLPAFVKIAALGTLADVVPLVGENRVIAKPASTSSRRPVTRSGSGRCSNRLGWRAARSTATTSRSCWSPGSTPRVA